MIEFKEVENISEGAELLARVFGAEGEFYSECEYNDLVDMFEEACKYCKENGWIFGAFDGDRLVGISLRFIYSPNNVSYDLVCEELQKTLNNHIKTDSLYLLYSAVDKDYRGLGIGKHFEQLTNNINIPNKFSDFSNKRLINHMKKLGWKTVDFWNGCEVMINGTR